MKDQHKIHETKQDKSREKTIINELCRLWGLSPRYLPWLSRADAVLTNLGEPIFLVEAKYRKCKFGQYTDYTIDKSKIDDLREEAWNLGVVPVLAISFLGEIQFTLPKHAQWKTSFQKRRDRDELADEVYHIPWTFFQPIKKAG